MIITQVNKHKRTHARTLANIVAYAYKQSLTKVNEKKKTIFIKNILNVNRVRSPTPSHSFLLISLLFYLV